MARSRPAARRVKKGERQPLQLRVLRERAEKHLEKSSLQGSMVSDKHLRRWVRGLQVAEQTLNAQKEELRRMRRQLEASEERFGKLFDLAPVGYLSVDTDGNIRQANLSAARMFGVARDQLARSQLARFVASDSQARFRQHQEQMLGSSGGQHCELWMVRSDGSRFLAQMDCSRLRIGPGDDGQCLVVMSDLTEREHAEAALRESEAAFRGYFENLSVGAVQVNAQGQFVRVNDRYCTMTGYSREELLNGMGPLDLDHPDERDADRKRLVESLRGGPPYQTEKRYITKDGRVIWVRVSARSILNTLGQVRHSSGVVEDITERKLLEQQTLLQSTALETAANGIVITDRDGVILWANEAVGKITGFALAEVIGQKPSLFKSGEHDQAFYAEMWATILAGDVWRGELVNRRKDGSLYMEEMTITPVRASGDAVSHFIAIKQDITKRKAAEKALREAEERLRLFIEQAPAALAMFDRQMRYLSASSRWKTDYHLGERELRGLCHYEVFPEIPERWKEVHRRALAGETLRASSERFERADGSVQWIQWEAQPWHDAEGEIGGIVIFSEDITEQTRAQEALRESQARLDGMIGAAMDGIISIDQEQRIILFNVSAERMFGHTADQVIGKPLSFLMPARFRSKHKQHVRSFGETRESSRKMGSPGMVFGRRADGTEFPVEASISQIGEAGGRRVYTVILRDITERLRAETELQRSAQLLDAFFDQAPTGLLWVSPEGRMLRVNDAYLRLLGCTREECIGEPVSQFHVVPEAGEALLGRLARKETLDDCRGQLRCSDGAIRQVMISANGFWERRRLVHSCWFVRDVTPLVELEREILSITEREQLRLGQDLHDDVCQRLATIEFLGHALERELAGNSRLEEAERAKEIGKLVRDTINRTRGMAAGLCPVELQVEGLRAALLHLALRTKRIFGISCRVRSTVSRIDDPQVEIHLYRIAQEAVSNAIKHGQARNIEIRLAANNRRVVLGVKDNGVGIVGGKHNPKAMGIRIMQYRAGVIGGSLIVQKSAQGGTVVICSIAGPLPVRTKPYWRA